MAKKQIAIPGGKAKKNRKGIHAKNRSSNVKGAKNYLKRYAGQGR